MNAFRRGLCLALSLVGCARPQSPATVVPASEGRPLSRPYVSPHSYEWFVRGELHRARGEFAHAAEAYQMALTGPDEDPLVLARWGEALAHTGDFAGAERALDAAFAHDAHSEAAWLALGRIETHRGRHAAAIAAYERAEQAAPHAATAPLALAKLLERQGAIARATIVLERAAARSPRTNPDAADLELELATTRRDAQALMRATTRLLREGTMHAARLRQVAHTLEDLDEPQLAARLWMRIPATVGDAGLRLQSFIAAGMHDRAEGLLALYDHADLGGITTVARAYLTINRPELAEHLLATHGSPDQDAHALLLARALLDQGRPDEAAAGFATVLRRKPTDGIARQGLSEALEAGGLPHLAAEIDADAPQ